MIFSAMALTLLAIAVLHVHWGLGGVWPGRDAESGARNRRLHAVVAAPDAGTALRTQRPALFLAPVSGHRRRIRHPHP